jgi:hypothetical protein
MTKSQYREYIQSDEWREFRRQVLEECNVCFRCSIPRWLAEIIYDQDLHLHHRHYRSIGNEKLEDLEVLCRRCHELETFGRSELRELKPARCLRCEKTHFDYRSDYCLYCDGYVDGAAEYAAHEHKLERDSDGRLRAAI